jgi:hypothetical protein
LSATISQYFAESLPFSSPDEFPTPRNLSVCFSGLSDRQVHGIESSDVDFNVTQLPLSPNVDGTSLARKFGSALSGQFNRKVRAASFIVRGQLQRPPIQFQLVAHLLHGSLRGFNGQGRRRHFSVQDFRRR